MPPGLDRDIVSWSVDDVCAWLELLGCAEAVPPFREHDICGVVLMTLAPVDQVLTDVIGIRSYGQRKIIAIARNRLVNKFSGGASLSFSDDEVEDADYNDGVDSEELEDPRKHQDEAERRGKGHRLAGKEETRLPAATRKSGGEDSAAEVSEARVEGKCGGAE